MITREDALLIFGKWHSEKTAVTVEGNLFGWSIRLRGKIDFLTGSLLHVKLDGAELALDLTDEDLRFEYGEPSSTQESNTLAAVVVALPLRVTLAQVAGPLEVPKRELLTFVEEKTTVDG